jgi:serine/threonine protein kinase/Tfp pilus assembly protein PilF
MADSDAFPPTADHSENDGPSGPTIGVTMNQPPPILHPASGPGSATAPSPRDPWRPPPSDATPPMTDVPPEEAATRMQDRAAAAAFRAGGMPDIPGYEIIAEIGRGGMGVVYKARQLDLNRPVALKMIIGEFHRPEQLIRFRLEAETAARVRHTNVVQVYDSGAWNGLPYLVLEWVDGGSLATYVKHNRQSPRAAARMISVLARALHATHCSGIIHRDLKPGNILVARTDGNAPTQTRTAVSGATHAHGIGVTLAIDGQPVGLVPKVTDFGLAKEMTSDTHLTETGRALGTPEYMAPEQAEGRQREVGPPTDVYALGIILYQMLAGRTPFYDTGGAIEIMHRVVHEEPKPPRADDAKVPRDLQTICMKCLQKQPDKRYTTAAELADDLDAFLDKRPISARPTGKLERMWKWAARRPAVAALAAALVIALVGGVAGITVQWREAVAQRDRAVAAEKQALTEKAVSDAENKFIVDDLLATATPEKQLGRKITVEDVLQNASARIDGRFTDQPQVAASLRLVLGNSYRKLGQFDPAKKHLAAAVDLRRRALGNDHRDTLAAESDRGLLLADVKNWDEALPLLRRVVTEARDKLGPSDLLTIEATERLALVLQQRGDNDESEKLFRETVELARGSLGADAPLTLTVLNDYGLVLLARNKLSEAEAAFREAAERREKALAPAHPETLESLNNLAAALDAEGKWVAAKDLYKQVLAEKKRVLGEQHVDTLYAMNNLAQLLDRHGETEEARVLLDEAYEGLRKTLGPENPSTLLVQNNLGMFSFLVGTRGERKELLDRSERILAAVLAIRRRVLPPDHPDTLQSENNLGVLLTRVNKLDDAEPLLKEALAGRRRVLGPADPDTLETATSYAQLLNRRQKTAEAIAVCKEGLTDAEKAGAAETPAAVRLLLVQVEFAARLNADQALAPAERAVLLSRKVFGENDDQYFRARNAIGSILLALKRPAEAEPHLRVVYDAFRVAGPGDQRTFAAAGRLGDCLIAMSKYGDAEPILIENYEVLQAGKQTPRRVVQAAGNRLVRLYDAWGKPDKAAEWREKVK